MSAFANFAGLGAESSKLGGLPSVFDRNFVLWYFFPSLLASATAAKFVHGVALVPSGQITVLDPAIITALYALLVALLLLIFDRSITRVLEGYGVFNPARLLGFRFLQQYRFRHLSMKRDELVAEAQKHGLSRKKQAELARIGQRLAEEFPDEEEYLLPTRFGNVVRAFEVYSRVMYGLEGTEVWPRLLAVMPKDYRELADNAEAKTGLWVNVWFLSLLLIVDCLVQAVYWNVSPQWGNALFSLRSPALGRVAIFAQVVVDLRSFAGLVWGGSSDSGMVALAAVGAAATAVLGARAASKSAIEWGAVVKSSFDVFLPGLARKLGRPAYEYLQRDQWIRFSQAILYRLPDYLSQRVIQPVEPQGAGVDPSVPPEAEATRSVPPRLSLRRILHLLQQVYSRCRGSNPRPK